MTEEWSHCLQSDLRGDVRETLPQSRTERRNSPSIRSVNNVSCPIILEASIINNLGWNTEKCHCLLILSWCIYSKYIHFKNCSGSPGCHWVGEHTLSVSRVLVWKGLLWSIVFPELKNSKKLCKWMNLITYVELILKYQQSYCVSGKQTFNLYSLRKSFQMVGGGSHL